MARATEFTCFVCGKKFPIAVKNLKGKNKYCPDCFAKERISTEQYKALMGYIFDVFKLEKYDYRIVKQVKKYHDEYGWNYAAIHYALWYCLEILEYKADIKYGIGCVEYHFNDAKEFYLQQEKLQGQANKIKNDKVKIVKSSQLVRNRNGFGLVDLNSML